MPDQDEREAAGAGCSCCAPQRRSVDDIREECLLPREQRPGREAEFDAVLRRAARNCSRPAPTRLRLLLDASYEAWTRDLAEREKACCSFFTFTFARPDADTVQLDVSVPASHAVALDALAGRADAIAEGSA